MHFTRCNMIMYGDEFAMRFNQFRETWHFGELAEVIMPIKSHSTVDQVVHLVVIFPHKVAFLGRSVHMLPARVNRRPIVQSNKKTLALSMATTGEFPKYFTSNEVRMAFCGRLHEKHYNAYFLGLFMAYRWLE